MARREKKLTATQAFEHALKGQTTEKYVLRLYLSGMTPRSMEALVTIKSICNEYLHGRYTLEVIDIYKNPSLAAAAQIIAVPTLIKEKPEPQRRFVGNLSDQERVLAGLNLHV